MKKVTLTFLIVSPSVPACKVHIRFGNRSRTYWAASKMWYPDKDSPTSWVFRTGTFTRISTSSNGRRFMKMTWWIEIDLWLVIDDTNEGRWDGSGVVIARLGVFLSSVFSSSSSSSLTRSTIIDGRIFFAEEETEGTGVLAGFCGK
jgi:hypothetical protein